jgi:hypothetical protein
MDKIIKKIDRVRKYMHNKDDLPKSIVIILVILAVVISVLGTFTVLNEVKNLDDAQVYGPGADRQGNGKISFTLEDRNDHISTGKISLTLENPEEI